MGINIQPKTDYSAMFQSLGSGTSNLNFISDYASIKNGSYGKLMKAYYAKDGNSSQLSSVVSSKKANTAAKEDVSKLTETRKSAKELKESADKLTTAKFEDQDETLKLVKDFVSDYNSLVKDGLDSGTSSITKKIVSMDNLSLSNEKSLNDIGIKLNDDGTLKLDEETFKKADLGSVKSLFSGAGSYGYSVSSQATLVDYQANYEGIKASTYQRTGSFNTASVTGSLYDTFF
ncbi:MAG: flagellar filament capping protein FliD [Lachnospiraceae bacterium]|nr:flagellar filament capping protein FliD [Lachnospiraceae bacterium]